MSTELIATLVVIAVLTGAIVSIYNGLITLRNRFKNAFSQVDVQLQRRYDLIPNLVNTAKEYMRHESETLQAVIDARNTAQDAKNAAATHPDDGSAIKSLMGAESALSGNLGEIFALSENYPDLKANTTMIQLMEELTSTENKVSLARQAYNDAVMFYNTKRETFPTNMLSSAFGFSEAEPFEVEDEKAKKSVKVSF